MSLEKSAILTILFINQNICCVFSFEPSQWRGYFEHPKQMLKFKDKKIFSFFQSLLSI